MLIPLLSPPFWAEKTNIISISRITAPKIISPFLFILHFKRSHTLFNKRLAAPFNAAAIRRGNYCRPMGKTARRLRGRRCLA